MRIKKSLTTLGCLVLGLSFMSLIFVGLFFQPSPAHASPEKAIVLKLSNWLPETGTEGKMGKWWGDELEKRTKGRIKIEYYFAQALVKTMDSLRAASTGIADVQFVADGYFPTQLSLIGGLSLLYQTGSGWVMAKCEKEMSEKYPPFQKMFKDNNIKPMLFIPATEVVIASTKPIKKLEDLKGKKVRAMGLMNTAMKMLGATPVAMPLPEVYEALERGTIDVVTGLPYHLVVAFKMHEVAKYIINPAMGCYAPGAYYMNLDRWEKLPKEIKQIINKINEEGIDVYADISNKLLQRTTETLLAAKCNIYSLPRDEVLRWKAPLVPKTYDDWISEVEKKGLPGKETLGTYQKLIKKYEPQDKYVSPYPTK